jgi:hypothetical protein
MRRTSIKTAPRLLLSLSLLLSTQTSILAAEDGNLDSMWIDPPAQSGAAATASAPAGNDGDADQPKAPSASDAATSAPMISLEDFGESAMVSKGGWPGVGPFKADAGNPNVFTDAKGNSVHLEVAGEHVTRAELNLPERPSSGHPQQDLLDLQMNVDFLLEAVGLKPKKIADLNAELEKNRDALTKTEAPSLNLKTGRFLVNIGKRKSTGGNAFDYTISINSMDAHKAILQEHSVKEEPKKPPVAVQPPKVETPIAVSTPTTSPPIRMTTTPSAPSTGDALKDEFGTVVRNWQGTKKVVLKTKETEELKNSLGGKALALQLNAVKWLTDNHKYYDMVPKGVVVENYSELVPGKKYSVLVQVKESMRYIDENSKQVLKDTDDTYRVTYTLEKQNGRWLIMDSAVVKSSPERAAVPKKTH